MRLRTLHRPTSHRSDLSASITVFLIAVPLSLGLALATGAPPQSGLVAAAVGGIVAGLLGGAPLQVSGAATGLVVVTAGLIQHYGWPATCAITVLAGLAQLLLGVLRVARAALAVSPAIVHGVLAGIGTVIAVGQLHVVLGGSPQSSAVANIAALPDQLTDSHPTAPVVGALTVAVLLGWPRLRGRARVLRAVPAPLAAVALATAVATGLSMPRVELPRWDAPVLPALPEGPVLGVIAAVVTVTFVASMESLLSAVAVDALQGRRPGPHAPPARLDRELLGQGASNMVSGMLGGMPIAGGAMRGSANVEAGARTRRATVLHGVWVLLCAGAAASALEAIPLAALAALVMLVGVRMVSFAHIRHVQRHRELPVYAATLASVVVFGVLQGVVAGGAVAVFLAMRGLTRTRVAVSEEAGCHRVRVSGQLTFLAVPRLTRAFAQLPQDADVVVELDGSFMDHAAYEALRAWCERHRSLGGRAVLGDGAGRAVSEPVGAHACRPWTPWRNHHCTRPAAVPATSGGQLLGGVSAFQRNTAPLVREELARLAREGQSPGQLFLTCADSRLVTSMITSSGPGDLFTVRNVGNLMPPPGSDGSCDSVAAAVEYAVEVLQVSSITVCGHSGCGAMQALLGCDHEPGAQTPLARWLRHGRPSLARLRSEEVAVADRPITDDLERLALVNVMAQLDHLTAHPCVARRVRDGTLQLHGMYFHVAEAQAYIVERGTGVFSAVGPDAAPTASATLTTATTATTATSPAAPAPAPVGPVLTGSGTGTGGGQEGCE
ncbi:SulP family inorganic anion transporter [Actinacidiphila sp. ITFR-21]|uniref:SulP family inorganic anion transporter n=1 Tax=Actinacidiphila sp. ITFR-21 TaxID=3075199 RepID=UPI00288C3939|nr:SulP family inorganic anion transporter [Streptomyces sp. ITFR-21]WNI16889.1 SulP family inorganic anion transporter [Streptomyces sp. ITFR-21]